MTPSDHDRSVVRSSAATHKAPPASRVPRLDSANLELEAGFLTGLARLNLLTSLVFDDLVQPFGLSFNDYLILGVVRRSADGRSSPGELCEVLGRTTGGMTLTLDRLTANGWVQRAPHPTDRRRIVVSLTSLGNDLSVAVNQALHQWELDLQRQGSSAELQAGLDALLAALESEWAD